MTTRNPLCSTNDAYATADAQFDADMMRLALDQAHLAFDEGEVPVGAVITSGRRVIGRGHNLTEMLGDVTAHAEMQAITAAAATLGGKYLCNCTLYVTVEPCLMCAGALGWSQISRIVYGASDSKRGFSTFTSHPFHPRTTVTAGVLADECADLMKRFFAKRRK